MTLRPVCALAALFIVAISLAGCGKETSSSTAGDTAVKAPASAPSMTAEQQQRIQEAGRTHQMGGRMRGQLMHQTRTAP